MHYREIMERSALDNNVNSLGRPITGNPDAFWAWFGKSKVKDRKGRPLVVFHGTDSDFSKFDPEMSNTGAGTGVPKGAFVFSDHTGVASSYAAIEFDRHGWRDPKITDAFRDLIKSGASWDEQLAFLEKHPAGYDEFKEGGNVMPCYLRIEKPLVVDAKGWHWHEIYYQPKGYRSPEPFTTNELAALAKEEGYDGLIVKNVKDVHKGPTHVGTTFFVFSPNQIKSALSNAGYSRDSDEIHEEAGDNAFIEPSEENIARARAFAMEKWKERARERGSPDPADLSYSCKFTSLFAQRLFGGKIQGNYDHQFLALPDGKIVDLNIDAEDVKKLGDRAHQHDPLFLNKRNRDWRDSMQSVQPRVDRWVEEFKSSLQNECIEEERIDEGLIAIPPKMHEHIDFLVTFNLLWKMRDRFRGKSKEFPELYAAFKEEVRKFGEKLPDERLPLDKNIMVWSIPVSTKGLPASYEKLKPRVDSIRFAIDWRPGARTLGGWRSDKDALIVYPMTLDYMERYPSKRSHPDDLRIALETIRETISHELRHMMQYVFIQHPDQTKMNPDYVKRGTDYLSSPVEFDPMIGSAVQEFLHLWKEYGAGGSLSKAVRQFTAAMPSKSFGTFEANRLFTALKKTSPERYKRAVRKFVTDLQSRLSSEN
jgi:hypothetical protein